METSHSDDNNFDLSLYHKYMQEDENMKAKIKTILNQIYENRVAIKVLHIEYSLHFSEIINSYQNRLMDNCAHYDEVIKEMVERRERILNLSSKLRGMECDVKEDKES